MPKLDTAQRLGLPVHAPERAYVPPQTLAHNPQYFRSDLLDRGRFRQELPDRVLYAEAFLCALALGDISQDAVPFENPAPFITKRHGLRQEPPVFAPGAAIPRLVFERLTTCHRMMPPGGVFNQVIGVNCRLPTRSQRLFPGEPRKLHPLPVDPNVAAVGLGGKRYRRDRLYDIAKLRFSPAQRTLSPFAGSPIACLAQCALYGGHEPRQPGLQNIIGGPDLEGFDRCFFAKGARNKDKRSFRAGTPCKVQRGKAVERRKLVIREDQVKFAILKSRQKPVAILDAAYATDELIGPEEFLYEFRIMGVILQQQNPDGRTHNTLFALPGGG